MVQLRDHQKEALRKMHNGCILCGDVGSGKSITGIAYYFGKQGGKIEPNYISMVHPKDLYIITTARKRDTKEWEGELSPFLLSSDPEINFYKNKVIIDSWNNIDKYAKVKDAFFIFDEQRVVGYGKWAKTFIDIAKANEWILLSATPGDTWKDYTAVFIANGFYKNKTEFDREHIIYRYNKKFPQIDRYINIGRLIRLRSKILVDMPFNRPTVSHHEVIDADYSKDDYRLVMKERWNIYKNEPIENASEFCSVLRRIVNSDYSRTEIVKALAEEHKKVIIFYNYDYELEILKNLYYGDDFEVAEWNGHKHQEIPECNSWIYLVQYTAGCEGWNCVKTDTIIFYSENYSYKVMAQASGRIDRMNTPFVDLYYYHLSSKAPIDRAILRTLKEKKKFNEEKFMSKIDEKSSKSCGHFCGQN